MITADGCWAEFRIDRTAAQGRPCLFLDRDGVLIEDTGYPHRPAEVVPIPEGLALVAAAKRSGHVVGIVTNQSGIARGLFGWPAFRAVQGVIDAALARLGTTVDFVLACPHHAEAAVPRYRLANHPWRKPAPGMLVAAAVELGLRRAASILVGDTLSDMEAARAAGVPHRFLMVEDGRSDSRTDFERVIRADLVSTVLDRGPLR